MTRWKASGIHLFICTLIALTVLMVMLYVWYPSPYFESMGGKELLFILLAVDLTLGPLITLIIYNPKKKSLKMDLSIIGFVQVAALSYGLSVLFQARPVYLVFAVDRFEVVSANEIEQEHLNNVKNAAFKALPITGPKLATALLPEDDKTRELILFSALNGGPDIQAMPEFYVDYDQSTVEVLERAMNLADRNLTDETIKKQVDRLVEKENYQINQLSIIPVRTKNKFITALIDNDTASVLKLVDVDPYTL